MIEITVKIEQHESSVRMLYNVNGIATANEKVLVDYVTNHLDDMMKKPLPQLPVESSSTRWN
jgi:hypothetical protein